MLPSLTARVDPERLFRRLATLRRRLRTAAFFAGAGTFVAVVVGGVTLAALLDWRLHLPPFVRALALVGLIAAAAVVFARRLVRPLRLPADNLALALRLESVFPHLNDALASAVHFLERGEEAPAAGAPGLRREAVRRAIDKADECDFRDAVDPRAGRRALLVACAAVLVAGPLAALFPAKAAVALTRLANPFGPTQWPPQTTLEVSAPGRLARGEPLEIRATLRGVIPERAVVSLRLADAIAPVEMPFAVAAAEGSDEGTMTARLEPSRVPKSLQFRVRANDADSGWRSVAVLPPPELVPLDGRPSPQVRVEFPAYTDLPPRQLPDGGTS